MISKPYFRSIPVLLTAAMIISTPYALADKATPHEHVQQTTSSTQQTPTAVAENTTKSLFSVLKKDDSLDKKKSEAFHSSVESILVPSVAFDAIARGVMGKYAHRVSQTDFSDFVSTFQKNLLIYYSKVLKNYDTGNLHVISTEGPHKEQLDAYNKTTIHSVPVNMTIGSGGHTYQLSYSMMKENGTWKIRNIIIEGINLGIQFRNQFADAVNTYHSPQRVIKDWSRIMQNKPIATPSASKG